ncbi:peroxisome targeting signal receptor [Laetiporus sulphureus 93-53]|uniref:Peroxisome targeting signal receptor n=1 Tax=Laetiporus sulphureus 93-53 TaxID=1314785 RepID=A0A165GQI1_9APHY|nr:peroxisome targeting signal receptor [Laetiporus sulphureus 93-53]KZT10666.1 peroxisome targeting signal receptor [Laetiporus sulphureus 93-53]
MSLQGLISGSECAVPFNPLSQVLKHTEGDRSVQQDRIAGPSSARLHHLPSTSSAPGDERDLALARQFFDGNATSSGPGPAFALAHYPPPQMGRPMEVSVPRMGGDLNKAWEDVGAMQFAHEHASRDAPSLSQNFAWTTEFSSDPSEAAQRSVAQRPDYAQSPYVQSSLYRGALGSGMMYGSNLSAYGAPLQSIASGKGKGKEIDMEAAFKQAFESFTIEESGRIVEEKDDVSTAAVEGAQASELRQSEEQEALQHETDFQKVWDSLQHSELPPPQDDMAKWEAQFNQLMSAQREDGEYEHDYGKSMQQAWEDGLGGFDSVQDGSMQFTEDGLPILDPYVFEKDNKYMLRNSPNQSNLQAAKALLDQNGSLSEVALLLEAAIQQGELGNGGYEAWVLLGEVRSMDEREDAAIRALAEGVRRAEETDKHGEGMLSLAIAYTNESLERASHTMLLRWLHDRFPTHPIPDEAWKSLSESSWHSHERVTEAYLSLAREQYSRGEMDADVQVALGVLFYTSNDFDRAKDCFEAALVVRPKDYLLWNRLGSSLSNGNKPEEALGAYREALQLRPTYTRAIYNVGVACLNIGAHKEAAEHLLSALAMQDMSAGAKSDQLWYTLRRVFLAMGRHDLADMAKSTADVDAFRKEGFDF